VSLIAHLHPERRCNLQGALYLRIYEVVLRQMNSDNFIANGEMYKTCLHVLHGPKELGQETSSEIVVESPTLWLLILGPKAGCFD